MKRILVVEEFSFITQAMQRRFGSSGYQVVAAGNLRTAWELGKELLPELTVLDVALPDGTGLELARRFRQDPATRTLPIILLTDGREPELPRQIIELGIAGLVHKPYDPDELLELTSIALRQGGLPSRPRPAEEVDGNSKAILIVEDDEKTATALAVRVQAAGYKPIVAHDAVSGLTAAVKHPPHLVLMDISIPAGNGFSVAERIQRLIPQKTPIIFLTAGQQPELRQKAAALGAAAFVQKPFDSHELLAAIDTALLVRTDYEQPSAGPAP